jgi:drug/metabolite transporter (DMT)-like permease
MGLSPHVLGCWFLDYNKLCESEKHELPERTNQDTVYWQEETICSKGGRVSARPVSPTSHQLGLFIVVFGATLLGLAAIFVRWALLGGATPITIGLYRMLFALPGILLLVKKRGFGSGPGVAWGLLAGLAFAGDLTLWHESMKSTSAANSTFIVCGLTPVWVALYSVARRGVRYRGSGWVGQLLGLGGAALLALARGARVGTGRGELFAIAASFCYALFSLAISQSRKSISARQSLVWMSLGSLGVFLVIELCVRQALSGYSGLGWVGLVGLALVVQLLAWLIINRGLGQVTASLGTLGLSFQQVATPVFAAWLLHEPLKPLGILGGAIVVAGICLVATGERRPMCSTLDAQ